MISGFRTRMMLDRTYGRNLTCAQRRLLCVEQRDDGMTQMSTGRHAMEGAVVDWEDERGKKSGEAGWNASTAHEASDSFRILLGCPDAGLGAGRERR